MNQQQLEQKTLAVIQSCETIEQLSHAETYARNAMLASELRQSSVALVKLVSLLHFNLGIMCERITNKNTQVNS